MMTALCRPFTSELSAVISLFLQHMRLQHSLSFLHTLPCLNLYFNRKLLPISSSRLLEKTTQHYEFLIFGDFNLQLDKPDLMIS